MDPLQSSELERRLYEMRFHTKLLVVKLDNMLKLLQGVASTEDKEKVNGSSGQE